MTVPLVADVKLRGVEIATAALRQFNNALGQHAEQKKKMRSNTELTTASMLKLWAAFQFVTSASTIASAVFSGFGAALGFIIDTILLPFLPLMMNIEMALFRFGQWFSEQGPTVRAGLLLLGAAMFFAFGTPMAIAIGTVLALLGLMYAWSSSKGAFVTGIVFGLAAAFLAWGVAVNVLVAPVWIVVAAVLALVAVVMLLRAAWLAMTGQGFELPSIDSLKASIGLPTSTAGGASVPMSGGGTLGGGGGTTFNDESINVGPIYTTGGHTGGRDAGIAMGSQAAMARRAF